ncbi:MULTISPECIES: sensor domain-containing diguanylate cyclase [Pseudomonas]|uniref:sensor domain-containing diguanylate cyclase n=1 Tax=Pseudomonas TaxID=286 RepID=UPI00257B573B|nr:MULTISPECIES: diguanylate cyclase [Pseudomonas]
MNLRKRLLWLFIPTLTLTLVAVGALSERLLLSHFDRQDSAQLMSKSRHLHEHMEADISRHLDLLRSLAWWDLTYTFIERPRVDYIRSNLPAARLANLDLDFMVFFDRQPRIVAQTWRAQQLLEVTDLLPEGGKGPRSMIGLRQGILQRSRQMGSLDYAGDAQHAMGQVMVVQGVALLLVSSPISDNLGKAPPNGVVVAGQILDQRLLDGFLQDAPGSLRVVPLAGDTTGWQQLRPRSSRQGEIRLSPRRVLDASTQQVDLQFFNPLGEAELRLQITQPRLLYQQGRTAVGFFLGLTLLLLVAALLLAYTGLDRWVLRRVRRLNQEVAAIGIDRGRQRLSEQGDDELGQLAGELNHMLERLERSEERDKAILDSIQEGYFEIAPGGEILAVNRSLERQLDCSREQLVGHAIEEILDAEVVERARTLMLQSKGERASLISPFKRRDGSLRYFETRFSNIEDADGQYAGIRGILRDVSDLVAYQNSLLDMAYRDPLTGLGNRKAFDEHLHAALEKAQQDEAPLALLFIDLDRFKEVNDRFGHDLGDALLTAIAERLRGALRHPDHFYRLGGDEFTLLLGGEDASSALALAERLLQVLEPAFELNGQRVDFVTPSIGIALYPDHARQPDELIRAADSAMYQAKQRRNQVFLYRPQPDAR